MDKQSPTVEWTIIESDADWERLQGPPRPEGEPDASRRLLQRYCWRVAALLLLLATGGSGVWRSDQTALPSPAASGTAQLALSVDASGSNPEDVSHSSNQWGQEWWRQFAQAYGDWPPGYQPIDPGAYADVTVQTVEFADDRAVARVITMTTRRGRAHRQTWFCRHTDAGWLRTEPDAALWGPARSLETPYFVYHFRQKDTSVVSMVAPQLDTLYTTMRRNVGLPRTSYTDKWMHVPLIPDAEKLVVEIRVTQSPGQAAPQLYASDRFLVPSPAVSVAPVDFTDAELLAQSIALPLIEQVLAQAKEHHAIGQHWQPLVKGLHLWQVWELDLPLAAWREDIVQWLYVDLPALGPGQPGVLPAHYEALCAAHMLWLPSPVQLDIPLVCTELDEKNWSYPSWVPREPLLRLDQLILWVSPEEYIRHFGAIDIPHPGQTVALATLIEYAVATYGRDRLPALVAGLGQHESWDTLLPAVFGVSPAEFEAGWQAYLAAHYGAPSLQRRG
jgi:hypothetical protein